MTICFAFYHINRKSERKTPFLVQKKQPDYFPLIRKSAIFPLRNSICALEFYMRVFLGPPAFNTHNPFSVLFNLIKLLGLEEFPAMCEDKPFVGLHSEATCNENHSQRLLLRLIQLVIPTLVFLPTNLDKSTLKKQFHPIISQLFSMCFVHLYFQCDCLMPP